MLMMIVDGTRVADGGAERADGGHDQRNVVGVRCARFDERVSDADVGGGSIRAS
jgi:hypothetical protein